MVIAIITSPSELMAAGCAAGWPPGELAEASGVSVRSGHKWLGRHEGGDRVALGDRSIASLSRPAE